MKVRPLIGIATAFTAGIVADNFLNMGFLPALSLTLTLLIVSFCLLLFQRKECGLSLLLLTFMTGFVYHHYVFYTSTANNITHLVGNKKIPVRLRGTVVTNPVYRYLPALSLTSTKLKQKTATFLLNAESVEKNTQSLSPEYERTNKMSAKQPVKTGEIHWQELTGKIKVTVYPLPEDSPLINRVKYGNRIELIGCISNPPTSYNPRQFDYNTYLRRQKPKIDSFISVVGEKNIHILSENHGNHFFAFIHHLKMKLNTIITTYVKEESAPVMRCILLGDRETVDPKLMDSFLKTGTIHFLAISGLHVGILVISLHFFLKYLRFTMRYTAIIIILFTFLFACITGMKTPILRAGIMVTIFYGSYVFQRRWNLPNSIAAAVFLILLINPSDLFNVGFQLSVIAMLGIICYAGRIENYFWKSTLTIEKLQAKDERTEAWFQLKKYCRKTFCVSLAAWVAVLPLIGYYFHIVTPLAVLLNIIILPFIWLILISGFCLLLLGVTFPIFITPFSLIIFWAETALRHIILTVSTNLNVFHYTSEITFEWVFIYYLFALFLVLRKYFRIKRKHMVLAALAVSNIFIFSGFFYNKRDFLQITCFDVNHGTSIFIQFPNGKNMLFDCGSWSRYDVGEGIVTPFLWGEKVKKIDTVVISHEDDDHCNGIPSLAEKFKIENVFIHKFLLQSGEKKALVNLLLDKKIHIRLLADCLQIKGYEPAKITVLNPPDKDLLKSNRFSTDHLTVNDTSIVLLVEYLNYKMLFCADIGKTGIRMVLTSMEENNSAPSEIFPIDIIQVPHHGGFIENTEDLVRRTRPKYAIVSGDTGIVSQSTIETYHLSGTEIFTTYEDGAITIRIGDGGIKVSKYRY